MDRHLLIAGQGRSGSTLFYNMLRHTLMDFQLFDLEVPAAKVIHLDGNTCTKRPYDIFNVPAILKAAQGRKTVDLIVTLRDPRDILTSRHRRVPDDYFYAADHAYFLPSNGAPTFTAPGFLQVQKAIMEIARSGLFPQGVFYLKYEDLVQDPAGVQAMLGQQLGLTYAGRFEDFHQQDISASFAHALNGVRTLDKGRQRKWADPEHRARIIDQFTRFPVLHDIVQGLGYEPDRTWYDALTAETAS